MAASLSSYEIGKLTAALEQIGAVTDPDAFPGVALEASASVVSCEVATYNEVEPLGSRIHWWPEGVDHPPNDGEILSRYAWEHPLVTAVARTGDGSPRAISDFLTASQFRKLNIYRLIFGPMGLADQLAIGLPAPQPLIIGIALNRERRGFSDRDRLLANLIRPYLVQAHRSVRLAVSLEAASALALDNRVAVFVAGDGRVEPLRGEFPSWFPADSLFPSAMLDDEARAWLAAERSRGAGADGLPALTMPLLRLVAGARWMMRYVTTAAGPVIVVSRGGQTSQAQETVLRALGLTEREATVLRTLCQGASNSRIAAALGISVSGVKRHLESIYRKLGVRNRSEATALAVDTLAGA
jgi:DNA-binding CsgD family transcriptional regulator